MGRGGGNKIDRTGRQYGQLVALQQVERDSKDGRGRAYWECECSCGEITIVEASRLTSGHTNSCGCLRQRKGSKAPQWKGYGDISAHYWKRVEGNASRRGLAVECTIEEAWELFQSQGGKCNLSGLELTFAVRGITLGTASLDRIDSKKPYVTDNVQWIHKDINLMKNALDQMYFVDLCGRIAEYRSGEE